MQTAYPRYILVVVTVAAMLTTAGAQSGGNNNDAGSGADAGAKRETATPVGFGSAYGARLAPNDVDWFASSATDAQPTCVVATVRTQVPAYFALGAETGSGNVIAPMAVAPGETGVAGVAGVSPLTATLRVAHQGSSQPQGNYDFRFTRFSIPSTTYDADTGGDAGENTSTALATSPGCLGGHLGGFDLRDIYSIQVPAGKVVTYSLGTSASGISVSLVDSVGQLIGPVLRAGESATVPIDTPGVYYMSAQRSSASTGGGYVLGSLIGPEPSGCRPYCLD